MSTTTNPPLCNTSVLPSRTSVNPVPIHSFRRLVCSHCGSTIDVPVYCGNRFCVVCGAPRRARIRRRLEFITSNITFEPGFDFSHLVLTIKNTPALDEGFRILVRGFRKLRSKKWWKSGVKGGGFVLEVTGEPGNWHCHLHIVLQNRYIPHAQISRSWESITGAFYVHIQRIPKRQVILYLTKYLSKSEVPLIHQPLVSCVLKNFRLFQPFGTWIAISSQFVNPGHPCRNCGNSSWILEDLWIANLIDIHSSSEIPDRGDAWEEPDIGVIYDELPLLFSI